MAAPVDYVFWNQPASMRRMLAWLTVLMLLIMTGAIVAVSRAPNSDQQAAWIVALIMSGCFVFVLALIWVLTWPQGRRARIAFDAFRQGNYLAGWQYPDDFWQKHVERSARTGRNITRGIVALLAVIGLAIALLTIWSTPSDTAAAVDRSRQILLSVLSLLLAIMLGGAIIWFINLGVTRRRQRMGRHGWAFLDPTCAYCGGTFINWKRFGQALLQAKLLDATADKPAYLELTIGPSRTWRNLASTVEMVGAVASSHYTASSTYRQVHRIPIPPDQLPAVVAALPALASEENPNPSSPAAQPASSDPNWTEPIPAAPAPRSSPRGWWVLTGWLAGGGFVLFMALVMIQVMTGDDQKMRAWAWIGVLGLLSVIVALLTAAVALVKQVRSK